MVGLDLICVMRQTSHQPGLGSPFFEKQTNSENRPVKQVMKIRLHFSIGYGRPCQHNFVVVIIIIVLYAGANF